MTVSLIALGAGAQTLTAEAAQALQGAGLVVGAQRLLQLLPPGVTPNRVAAVRTEELARCILQSGQKQIAAVFSGDVGFYSGAGLLAQPVVSGGFQPAAAGRPPWLCMAKLAFGQCAWPRV